MDLGEENRRQFTSNNGAFLLFFFGQRPEGGMCYGPYAGGWVGLGLDAKLRSVLRRHQAIGIHVAWIGLTCALDWAL